MAHVLIVEDDEANRESLRLVLEYAGHAVEEVCGGKAALALLRTRADPHVVVLDLRMPPLDGQGVLEAVLAEGADGAEGAADGKGSGNGQGGPRPLGRHAFVVVTAAAEQRYPQVAALLV